MTEQLTIDGKSVPAIIQIDSDGAIRISMLTSDVDVRSWARLSRSAGFQVVYECVGGGSPVNYVTIDSRGQFRGVYGSRVCSIWLGDDSLFE